MLLRLLSSLVELTPFGFFPRELSPAPGARMGDLPGFHPLIKFSISIRFDCQGAWFWLQCVCRQCFGLWSFN